MLYSNNPYYGEVQQKKSVLKDTSFPQLLLRYVYKERIIIIIIFFLYF